MTPEAIDKIIEEEVYCEVRCDSFEVVYDYGDAVARIVALYADRIGRLEAALRHVEDALGYDKNEGKSLAVRESNAHTAWKIARAALAPEQDR